MKIEEARKVADEAISNLVRALEAGKSEALTSYLTTMARFHEYSWRNAMLIGLQNPDATLVAGYNRWLDMHRYVKKGEHGIMILAPMSCKRRASNGDAPADADAEDNEERMLLFKPVYVYDVSQTDGEALPEFATVRGEPNGHLDALRAVITKDGIEIIKSEKLGGAEGASAGGKIFLREGLSRSEEFTTLVHEYAHEKLHHCPDRPRASKKAREVEAEAVAFVVCQAVGLDTNTAASDYIQLYDGDKATLAASLDTIQRTSAEILAAIGA